MTITFSKITRTQQSAVDSSSRPRNDILTNTYTRFFENSVSVTRSRSEFFSQKNGSDFRRTLYSYSSRTCDIHLLPTDTVTVFRRGKYPYSHRKNVLTILPYGENSFGGVKYSPAFTSHVYAYLRPEKLRKTRIGSRHICFL